jgi:hypothetical protein
MSLLTDREYLYTIRRHDITKLKNMPICPDPALTLLVFVCEGECAGNQHVCPSRAEKHVIQK